MYPIIEDDCLVVRPPSLVIVSDAASSDSRLRSAATYLSGTARKAGSDVLHGVFSRGGLSASAALPDDPRLAHRGRFLTPLVEAGLGEAAGHATLICLVAGPIFDWDDWVERLLVGFSELHVVRFAEFERSHDGAVEHDVVGLLDPAIEERLRAIVSEDTAAMVRIDVEGGVLIGMPAQLRATPRESGVVYEGPLPDEAQRAALQAVSIGGDGPVKVGLTFADRESSATIDPAAPISPRGVTLDRSDADVVDMVLSKETPGPLKYRCPLCTEEHVFDTAFICGRSAGAVFCRVEPIVRAWRESGSCRCAFVPLEGGGWSAVPLPESSAIWLGTVALMQAPDRTHWLFEPAQQGVVAVPAEPRSSSRALEMVRVGLERDPVTGVVVASGADQR